MNARASALRRIANALTRHGGAMLPKSLRERTEWAMAMRQELDAIAGDTEALRWALGCVFAGYAERIRAMTIFDAVAVRAFLFFFIALEVLSNLFATIATIAYKTGHLGVIGAMSGQMPGDDYHPFIPLMNAIPWWVHALWVASALLYAVSAVLLFTRRRRIALPLFAAGFVLSLFAEFGSWIVITRAGLHPVVSPAPTLIGRIIQDIPEIYLPLAIIVVLWLIWRARSSRTTA